MKWRLLGLVLFALGLYAGVANQYRHAWLLGIWFVTVALSFALRIPGNWSRHTGHGESVATTDLIMVVLFGGLAAVVLLPTRRENRRTDVTSS
jgi:hypothetical protein